MHPLHLDSPILACHSETPSGSKNLPYISLSLPQLPGALPFADRFRRADRLVLGDPGLEGCGPGQQPGGKRRGGRYPRPRQTGTPAAAGFCFLLPTRPYSSPPILAHMFCHLNQSPTSFNVLVYSRIYAGRAKQKPVPLISRGLSSTAGLSLVGQILILEPDVTGPGGGDNLVLLTPFDQPSIQNGTPYAVRGEVSPRMQCGEKEE